MRLRAEPAREQVAPTPEVALRQPVLDRGPSLLGDFELDRSPGLLLDHGAAVANPGTGAHVIHLQADEIAAAKLAVDRKVEQSKIALTALQLKPDPNCPDIFRLQRALLAGQVTLVPWSLLDGAEDGIAVCMVASSIRPHRSQRAPIQRQANLPECLVSICIRPIRLAFADGYAAPKTAVHPANNDSRRSKGLTQG